jgi:serine/threonine-protein kinase
VRVEGPAQESTKPERFGRYVLLDRIGMGGMAEVYRAVMPGPEGFRRTFVVKRILGQFSQSESFVEMFVREARICGLLNHPNIVQVHDFGSIDGSYFLAMEYVRGRDLQAVLRRIRQMQRSVPVPVAAYIAREVAECLGYAHALTGDGGRPLNIIHRDVSPSNIMCLSAGGVKLLDFGIAKTMGEDPADRTERGAFKGKLSYMAPERVKREPIDGRSDLFSLGVVLWEMLAGRRLFRASSDAGTLTNVVEAAVPLPSSLRADVPPELDAIVMRALERDPDARYATGQAMAEDLEEVLHATRHNSKMLPGLLRDLFGDGLKSGQIPLAPEFLDLSSGSAGSSNGRSKPGRVEGSATTAAAAPPAPAAAVAVAVASVPEAGGAAGAVSATRRTWRRALAAAGAVSVTAALGVLLFGRDGGGRSHATTLDRPAVAMKVSASAPAAAPQAEARPSPAAPPAATAAGGSDEPAPAPTAADAPSPRAAREANEPDGARAPSSETPARRAIRSRSRAEHDRIARGLSIDPFANAGKRGGR